MSAAYRVELLDISAGRDEIIGRELLWSCPYARVPKRCSDCNGEVITITPLVGFASALLRVHQRGCPQFGSLVARAGAS